MLGSYNGQNIVFRISFRFRAPFSYCAVFCYITHLFPAHLSLNKNEFCQVTAYYIVDSLRCQSVQTEYHLCNVTLYNVDNLGFLKFFLADLPNLSTLQVLELFVFNHWNYSKP